MDPIIKTARISQTLFSLNRRSPIPDLQGNEASGKVKSENKVEKLQPAPVEKSTLQYVSEVEVAPHPVLAHAAVGKIMANSTAAPKLPDVEAVERERKKQADEKQSTYEKAKQDGYQAGFEAGKAGAQKECEHAVGQIGELLRSLDGLHEALFQEIENCATEVVFEAVTKIIGQAAIDKKIAYGVTREAIEQVKAREKLIVRVSAKDCEMVKAALHDPESDGLIAKSVSVVADNLVQLGGCLIETEAGSLDARLEIQLQRLKEILQGVRNSNDDA